MAQRTALILVLLGLTSSLLSVSGREEEEPPIHRRLDLPSIAACGGCHQAVWTEWSQSLHARAWDNPNVLAATQNFERKQCRNCHSPLPMYETGLNEGPGYRDYLQTDGVHCLSCHGLEDGVAAARTIPDAPCRPRHTPSFLEAQSCFPCHQPTHQAFDEYALSKAKAKGTTCADCHMPEVERAGKGGVREGRSHGPHGGYNEAFVRRAVNWKVDVVEGERALAVELQNRTGHKFPGEIPSRSFQVRVSYGEGVEPDVILLRRPFRGEERADNRLAPDETRILRFEPPPGTREVLVELLFSPLPLLPLEQQFVIGRWTSEL